MRLEHQVSPLRHEKDRVTVCLSAEANGQKRKAFIVFKGGKRDVKRTNEDTVFYPETVLSAAQPGSGRMNESLAVEREQYLVGLFASSLLLRDFLSETHLCKQTDTTPFRI